MKEERNFKLREREKHKLRQIYKQEKCRQRDRQRYIIMNIRREGGKKKAYIFVPPVIFFLFLQNWFWGEDYINADGIILHQPLSSAQQTLSRHPRTR